MACDHQDRMKVYRRGAGPSYPFLPAGAVCPKCKKWLAPAVLPSTNEVDGG